MRTPWFRGLAALALLGAVSPRAGALVITQSIGYSFDATVNSGTTVSASWGLLPFAAFNDPGALLSVGFTVAVTGYLGSTENNVFSTPLVYTPRIEVGSGSMAAGLPLTTTATFNGPLTTLAPGAYATFAPPLDLSWSTTWSAPNQLALFTGPAPLIYSQITFRDTSHWGGLRALGNVTVTLDYTYAERANDAPAVPEHGSTAALGALAGLALWGFAHRKNLSV